jgi:CRP/FNR family transcriptional regulator, anaerobic regulatory protein
VVRDARLIGIEAEALQRVLKNHFNLTLQLIQHMAARQTSLEKQISSFFSKDIHARLADLILELAQKYGECAADSDRWELEITHQELSDFLGVARQTVSCIMSEFSNLGLLEKQGQKLHIKNQARLKAIIEQGAVRVKASAPSAAGLFREAT